ncbi:MAG: alpha/beta hydrolase [Rhodobiaceae bacterium]|nr:alpha/beta hydrolase [Rhodobiaceae bacterium]
MTTMTLDKNEYGQSANFASDYADRFYESDGLKLHYTEWNPDGGQPVIMLHGLNVQTHTWDPIAHQLSQDMRIICPDLRGHGDSDWARQGYPVGSFVSDLNRLADSIGADRFSLVGHSLGARIAIAYAGEHSDRLDCLALSDTGPQMPKSAAKSTSQFIGDTNSIKGFRSRQEVWDHYRKIHPEWMDIYIDLHAAYQVRENWAGKYILKADPELYWITRSAGVKEIPYLWDMAAAIDVPTLIMVGDHSEFFDDELLERMRKAIKNSEVAKFDTGHYIPREKPDEFAQQLAAFLRTHRQG